MVSDSQNSILALVAGVLAPIFLPVGFGDWRIVTALISGFMAKESVVSSLTVLFGSSAALQAHLQLPGQQHFSCSAYFIRHVLQQSHL